MMQQTPPKSTNPQKPHHPSSLRTHWKQIALLSPIALIILGLIVWFPVGDYFDERKFNVLEKDFKALQTDLNEIDDGGWEYSAGCSESPKKLDSSADGCYVSLQKNYSDDSIDDSFLESRFDSAINARFAERETGYGGHYSYRPKTS